MCSIYELQLEWNEVRDGLVVSSRLVFDTAAFLALMLTDA